MNETPIRATRREVKAERLIPLFPELRGVLMEAYGLAPEGSVYVVGRYRDTTANLGTQFKRIIHRAGLIPWPRLFNAMRASRVTELAAEYPAAICTLWMGHTQAIAEAHYQMVRDEDYERAARTPTIGPDAKRGNKSVAECVAHGGRRMRGSSNPHLPAKSTKTDRKTKKDQQLCRSLQVVVIHK